MKKVICKIEYDTEASTLLKRTTSGAFGDADGYEENLYQTEKGYYFLYVNGGPESKYPKEEIRRIAKDKAQAMLAE